MRSVSAAPLPVRHVHGSVHLVDVRRYPAARTTPPDGIPSALWIRARFAAAAQRGESSVPLASTISLRGPASRLPAR